MNFLLKSILVGSLLASGSLYAQNNSGQNTIDVTLPCYDTTTVFGLMKEKMDMIPVVMGQTDDKAHSIMTTWVNPKTNEWAVFATAGDTSCLIGSGKNLKFANLGQQKGQYSL